MTPKQGTWYALRRTLPPWRFEEALDDLLKQIDKFQLDEVILFIDTEEFNHGHPSLEWARDYQKKLFKAKQELERRHVVFSLNPWETAGQADRGRDDREQYPGLECVVGHDGTEAKSGACFLSPVWRNHIRQLWQIYAETKPNAIWVEDDIRTFNHEPVRYGCFCPRHMKMFSERVGRTVTREELVAALLQPGEPHPWRQEYLQMQQDVMVETVSFLAKAVHEISPETCLGLMSSGPRLHCLEGRSWPRMAEALADGKVLYSRPPMSNYYEDSLRGFYYSQDSIKITRHALPPGAIELTECESIPFSRFSKSVVFTFLEAAVSFAYGAHGVALNLFDHTGAPMEEEKHFGTILAQYKPFFRTLSTRTLKPGNYRGIRIFHFDDASFHKQLEPGADYPNLEEDGYGLMEALESHGLPTVYTDSPVSALAGQVVRSLPDQQILELLSRGVFLDGTAAQILVERGFGELLGIAKIDRPRSRQELPWVMAAEEFHNPSFGGEPGRYLTATLPYLGTEGRFSLMEAAPAATVISHWVTPDRERVCPAMTAFTNRLGGRVVVHALEYQSAFGISYCSPSRRIQLHAAFDFLAGGCADVKFSCDGAYALAWRKDSSDETIVGVFNLNLDDWPKSEFTLAWTKPLPQVLEIDSNGACIRPDGIQLELQENRLVIKISRTIRHDFPYVLVLK